jgi:hypothetical protein
MNPHIRFIKVLNEIGIKPALPKPKIPKEKIETIEVKFCFDCEAVLECAGCRVPLVKPVLGLRNYGSLSTLIPSDYIIGTAEGSVLERIHSDSRIMPAIYSTDSKRYWLNDIHIYTLEKEIDQKAYNMTMNFSNWREIN